MEKKANQHILLLSLSGIGNFLMQSPVFAALKATYPQSRLTVWVAPRGTKILARNNRHIDNVIQMPIKKNSLPKHLANIQALRREKFDTAIVLSPGNLVKSAIYLRLAGISRRIGNSYLLGKNPHSSFLLTDTVPEDETLHDVEQNLRLLEPLGIPLPKEQTAYNIYISEHARQKASEILKAYDLQPATHKLIGFHAGSAPDFLWKRWPLRNFATVAKELIKKYNAHLLLFGGPDEDAQKKELQQLIGIHHASLISANLLTTAAIMQRCEAVVSNDSGLMHLAAASGTLTYGLFGPTSEVHTGPCGPKSYVIRATGTVPSYHTESNYNLGSKPHASMLAITPELVLSKIEPYLQPH
ncbi:MAG: lipopolysaccharide heptosyltransferase II [Candidatus Andersenbacteria bacterium]|nr:lipopolysaccharide heptosyltransferase II [Candidatus Andersenbacteria bacterium]